ncbi:hypothetical protein [Microvirga arsenatis]|uniref:Uncharacterized protein n=1 Tax=Microvirga arsenatis TaxID=2692265 RepID=A0ABW9YVD5_9HYPH|nr:hypothetical protein [Microvirga arsenatis]NBJ09782.1 hypothetical protein [Microvirga arsenatis]NBJ22851.1 hypothetical protein [Microvirga arsenatis]
MTEEEIEVVAEELAKIGGVTWYPGREKGTLMRVVCDRYRDRARVAIEALERYRAGRQASLTQDNVRIGTETRDCPPPAPDETIRPGATVIYRPPGDRRAYSCRVVEIEGNRAYLAPILRACTEWVSIEHLVPAQKADAATARD